MAYGARLESVLGASPRGFESPILRKIKNDPLWVFFHFWGWGDENLVRGRGQSMAASYADTVAESCALDFGEGHSPPIKQAPFRGLFLLAGFMVWIQTFAACLERRLSQNKIANARPSTPRNLWLLRF